MTRRIQGKSSCGTYQWVVSEPGWAREVVDSGLGELVASGFISGAAATQFVRTAGGKMDQLNNKLDALTEDVGYVKRNIDSVVRSLADIEQGVEAASSREKKFSEEFSEEFREDFSQ